MDSTTVVEKNDCSLGMYPSYSWQPSFSATREKEAQNNHPLLVCCEPTLGAEVESQDRLQPRGTLGCFAFDGSEHQPFEIQLRQIATERLFFRNQQLCCCSPALFATSSPVFRCMEVGLYASREEVGRSTWLQAKNSRSSSSSSSHLGFISWDDCSLLA